MDSISECKNVAVPAGDIDCVDNELVHPLFVKKYARAYAEITGTAIASIPELIHAFYSYHEEADFAGFKSMINRHPDAKEFIRQSDIQFIILLRRDLLSTIASFMLALEKQTWRRHGGKPVQTWTFDPSDTGKLDSNIIYVLSSNNTLARVPDAIPVWYEECCRPDFRNADLDEFFGAHIAFKHPKPPTSAADYVTNWGAFVEYVTHRIDRFADKLAT